MSEEMKKEGTASAKKRNTVIGIICAVVVIAAIIIIAVSSGSKAESSEPQAEIAEEVPVASLENLDGFERITMGSYEQDDDSENGAEPIEWIVLAEEDGKMLVTSLYGLESSSFHDALEVKIAWSNSSLRSWLNSEFLENSFTEEEKAAIIPTVLNNSGSDGEKGSEDEETEDMIFILSLDELNEYMPEEASRSLAPSVHAQTAGVRISKITGYTNWWLRAPREVGNHQSMINSRGLIVNKDANGSDGCVRPAMWIEAK